MTACGRRPAGTARRGAAPAATGPVRAFSLFLLVLAASVLLAFTPAYAQPIVFVDWSWDSALVHNRIAVYVAQHGFGYEVD